MQHSQVSPNARQQLAETVVLNKARLGLSWQDLADGTGLALTFVTAALLGQHALPEAAARKVAVDDLVIIVSYALMDFEEAKRHTPALVFPDTSTNRLI